MNPEHGSTAENRPTVQLMPGRALIVLACGLLATWLAGESLGWIAPPLQKTLTWLVLSSVVLLALGRRGAGGIAAAYGNWLLTAACVVALLMTVSAMAVVNILAVAVLMATVAWVRPGTIARAAGPVALAATALAVCRLLCESTATVWALADAVGRAEGHWAALLSGRPLLIGVSFGSVDFLVVMVALAVAWAFLVKQQTPPQPIGKRVAAAGLAIVAAQSVYLIALAFSHDLVSLLPPIVRAVPTDVSHLGVWTWSNAVHSLLPWHLPLLAAVLQTVVAIGMFRLISWPALPQDAIEATEADTLESRRRERRIVGNPSEAAENTRPQPIWLRLAPAGLLLIAAAATCLWPLKPDLTGRRIAVYDNGSLDWTTTDPGNAAPGLVPRYGLLKALVASLGGELVVSKNLNASDLRNASALVVLPLGTSSQAGTPQPEMRYDIRQKIWNFVKAGGGLLVAGAPEARAGADENALNALLAPTSIAIRDDTADSLTDRWECNLVAWPHVATAASRPGRSCFSIDRAASMRVSWPAAPLLTGRWCWNELGSDPMRPEPLAYSPGNRLGDLVLAAQQNFGQGSIVVLGDATCLSNDGIPFSYTFCGPLLAALCNNAATPLAWWRQALGLAAAGGAIVLLFRRFDPLSVTVSAVVLGLAMFGCTMLNDAAPRLRLAAAGRGALPIIYVDGSHLEAMGKNPWRDDGIGHFMRVLAAGGYLPLVAPDLATERLDRAKMLISIAPGRPFSGEEITSAKAFGERGGTFLAMTGSPDAEPSRPLLNEFRLQIPPMPLPPWQNLPETEPLGALTHDFSVPRSIARPASGQNQMVRFHAAWRVGGDAGGNLWPTDDLVRGPVIAGNLIGRDDSATRGQAFLLGDSQFALQKSFVPPPGSTPDTTPQNALFWQTTVHAWLDRAKN